MAWTNIEDSVKDADSPIAEDLIQDAIENTEYNHDNAIRAGTHATGVRMAMANGRATFFAATSTDPAFFTGTVTFATDADPNGADPNFSAAPTVMMSLFEDASGASTQWAGAQDWRPKVYITDDSTTATAFNWTVQFDNVGVYNIKGGFYWVAFGPVTSGE